MSIYIDINSHYHYSQAFGAWECLLSRCCIIYCLAGKLLPTTIATEYRDAQGEILEFIWRGVDVTRRTVAVFLLKNGSVGLFR